MKRKKANKQNMKNFEQMRKDEEEKRKKAFGEVQAIWAEQMPMICIAAPFSSAVIRSDVGNTRPSVASSHHLTWNVDELYLKGK